MSVFLRRSEDNCRKYPERIALIYGTAGMLYQ